MLPMTLQMAMLEAPSRFASRRAASVSAVSPDCVMMTASVFLPTIGIAVAVFRPVVDFDRQACELLDHELADQRGVPRRAARQNRHAVYRRQLRLGDLHLFEEDLAGVLGNAAEDRLSRGGRLLEDFLEHEVLVAGLLRHDRIPQHALGGFGHRTAEEVGKRHAAAGDDRHLFIAQEHDVAGVVEDRRDVGRDEELAVAETDHDRRSVANGDDLFGIVRRDEHQRKQAPHQQQRPPHGVFEAVVFHLPFDEVCHDFGVGLGDELVSLPLQFVFEVEIVFDDAVVDHDDLAGAIAVRMGVFLGRTSVRRPPGVADPVVTGDRDRRQWRFRDSTSLPALRRRSTAPLRTSATPAES